MEYLKKQEKKDKYEKLYPKGTVFFEEIIWSYNEQDLNFNVMFCLKGEEEKENIPFLTGNISLLDFDCHTKKLYDKFDGISDSIDHTGTHIQKDLKMSLYEFRERFMGKILADYIASGEYVDLND